MLVSTLSKLEVLTSSLLWIWISLLFSKPSFSNFWSSWSLLTNLNRQLVNLSTCTVSAKITSNDHCPQIAFVQQGYLRAPDVRLNSYKHSAVNFKDNPERLLWLIQMSALIAHFKNTNNSLAAPAPPGYNHLPVSTPSVTKGNLIPVVTFWDPPSTPAMYIIFRMISNVFLHMRKWLRIGLYIHFFST